jgi:DNA recombination protein RmuC
MSETGLYLIIGIMVIGFIGLAILLLKARPSDNSGQIEQIKELGALKEFLLKSLGDQRTDLRDTNMHQMESLRKSVLDSFTQQSGLLEQKLTNNLDQNFKAFKEMSQSLVQIKSNADQMLKISQEVQQLNQILSSPKLQGQFGETSLESLLSDILPQQLYTTQEPIDTGIIPDATVLLNGVKLCIDAKFPKDKMSAMLAQPDNILAEKDFVSSIKTMITEIGKKYVRPELGTANQALMYVPSENMYLDIVKRPELMEIAQKSKVNLVSPNTLGGLLHAVHLAYRSMEVQKNTQKYLKELDEVNRYFESFTKDFDSLGQRIDQSQDAFGKAQRDMERFKKVLGKIVSGIHEEEKTDTKLL